MRAEELEILDRFEAGELQSAPGSALEMQLAVQAARNTVRKTRWVNVRMTEHDFKLARLRAREKGLALQTLLSSVIHEYLSGRLTEGG